jgi:signal transduction histidine kinase
MIILKKLKNRFSVWQGVQYPNLSMGQSTKWLINIFLIFFFQINTIGAQDLKIVDSLKAALTTQSTTDQYETLVELTIQYVDRDNNTALGFIEQAYTAALLLADTAKIVRSGRIKGQLLRRLDRLDETREIFDKLLLIAKRNNLDNDRKVILNSLAVLYTDMANYDKALELNFQSLLIREAEGNKADISVSLGNIGRVYYKLNDYEKAIEYYERALQFKKEANETYHVDVTLINIGLCYNGLSQFDKALEYFKRGLKFCGENCPENIRMDGEYGLGVAYFSIYDFKEAKLYFNRSLALAKKGDNKRFQADNLYLLGRIAIKEGDYELAVQHLSTAEHLAQQAGYNKILIDVLRQFSLLYKEQQNYELASVYQDKYIQLKDSIFSEGLIKNLAAVQTKFEERENLKTIASKDEELWQQRQLNIAVATIAVLAALLVFMLIKSNRAKRKANERLDKEVQEATRDLRAAYKLLAEVNKELDHFIYKTSHDIRGPLASLKGLCNVALTDVEDPIALSYFGKIDFTATRLDTLLRRLQKINQINNAGLKKEQIDFDDLLNEVEMMERSKGFPERLSIKRELKEDIDFIADKELIYLILENLIDNAIKFYDHTKENPFVLIQILKQEDNIIISVIDNGIGIGQADPEELFQMFVRASERSVSGGIGLYLSRRATDKLGGEIHMRTTRDGFTEFYVMLPLQLRDLNTGNRV